MKNATRTHLRKLTWYSRYRNIRLIIQLGKCLPRFVQQGIGECMLLTAEEYWLNQERSFNIKSMRKAYLITAMYKTPENRTWYDAIPEMQNAFNLMMQLPEFAMQQIDDQCAVLLDAVRNERNHLRLTDESRYVACKEACSHFDRLALETVGYCEAV